jgi:PAS domain S-box-containing protein
MPAERIAVAEDTASKRRRSGLRRVVRERSTFTAYLISVAAVALAFVLTVSLEPYMGRAVTPLFFGAVSLSAWYGGFWPGIVAVILSLPAIHYTVASPIDAISEAVLLIVFSSVAMLISSLNSLRKHAETIMRQQQIELELRVTDRTAALSAANMTLRQEIAVRMRAEETLRESEDRFRALFEEAPVAYHEIDTQGIIRRVNRAECELLQRKPEELIGQPVWEFLVPEQRERSKAEVLRKTSGEKELVPFVRQYRRIDGSPLSVEIHENVIRDRDGAIVGIRSALLDITERLAAEEHVRQINVELERRVRERTAELEKSNDSLQQFAYSASHDLQEPLRMVSSYTKLIEKRYEHLLDEDGKEFLHYIVNGADRMSRLIRDLLAFSRAGDLETASSEEFEMAKVVENAIRNLESAIEESGALVTADSLPKVRGKEAGMAQVLQNLLSNSIKYRRDEPPRIHISARSQDSEWLFCIEDNGMGFDQADAERAFGVFKRLHGNKYAGTGIGLAICKRIVERYGGRIWAESERGVGSRFYFTLPLEPTAKPRP